MNSLWSLFSWFFPSIQLPDDLNDPEALPDAYLSLRRRPSYNQSRLRPQLQLEAPLGDWGRERERERYKDYEAERDRQLISHLEQDNAALKRRIDQLEHDLHASNQSLSTLQLLAAPPLALTTVLPSPPSPPLDPSTLSTTFDALRVSQDLTHQALNERTEELSSLRSFLSKTDDWSGAQLLQALRDLNAEVVQLAASLADEYAPSLDRRVDLTRNSDRDFLDRALGGQMLELLAKRDHSADPTFLQFAVQAWEIVCLNQILDAFCFGLPQDVDDMLAAVFERMHQHEPQPTTARWRALTHTHLRAMLPSATPPTPVSPGSPVLPSSSSPLDAYTENALRGIISILAIAGCSDSRALRRDPLRARFGMSLTLVGQRAVEIARAIREGVMSAAFEVVAVPPAIGNTSRFDEGTMENMFAGISGAERGRVLCTVEFGLTCVRKTGSTSTAPPVQGNVQNGHARKRSASHGSHANGSNGNGHSLSPTIDTGGLQSRNAIARSLLLKPKVILESVKEVL